MCLDDLQQAWQSQPSGAQLRISADMLLKELRRNQRNFRATIFWRDFREIGVAGVLFVVFLWPGLKPGGGPWLFLAATMLWVAGFMLVDRWRQRRQSVTFPEPLVSCIQGSLREVNHQIWLLKNVLWWYLLPPSVGLLVVFGYGARLVDKSTWWGWALALWPSVFCIILFAGIYWLNQYAVRTELEPRRQELLGLHEGLSKPED